MYAVNDKYSGANFGQQEKSDGQVVNGQYRVALPDGRTQIVTYNADWKNGFNADVQYEVRKTIFVYGTILLKLSQKDFGLPRIFREQCRVG